MRWSWRRGRLHMADCLMCGGTIAMSKGYILIDASNYSPLLPIKIRRLPYRYAHKGCWPK